MVIRRRLGGLPLAVYVVALLMMPMAAVAVLSLNEVGDNNRAERAAHEIVASIEVELAAVRASGPLEIERIALVGLARLDELGIDRDAVVPFTEAELEGLRTAHAAALDRALDGLEAAIRAESGGAVTGYAAAIDSGRRAIEDQRALVDQGNGRPYLVDSTFAQVSTLLDSLVGDVNLSVSTIQAGAVDATNLVGDLRAVVTISRTAATETAELSNAILFEGSPPITDMMASTFRHADALADATAHHDLDAGALANDYAALSAPPPGFYDGAVATGRALLDDPALLDAFVDVIVERIDYLGEVETFAVAEGAEIAARAEALSATAERRNRATFLVLLAVGLGSLLIGVVVIRSFARPLIELRAEAERISAGDLDAPSLPLEGPSDIRKVTAAMNEMAGTLRSVDAHMKALASGDSDEGTLGELPGEVGASMRHSVERVTVLTTELQLSQQLLERQARRDPLTGLPNRLAMHEHLERLLAERDDRRDVGVMFVDVDGFKSVNDTHGHAIGDLVLTEIAHRLSDSVRDVDMVGRLGGDEFLVVVEQCTDRASLESFGERMIREIEQPHAVGDQLFAVSASVGVTRVEPGDDAMAAIARADAAVYHAKRRGRRRVEMFDADLQNSIERTAELELALRRAIESEELRLHLQPMCDLTTGDVTVVEALVRWDRPGVGLVSPADFIPIAERSGLIFDLERWVIREACQRVATWHRMRAECERRLAVNISGRHLIEGDLLADLDEALAATGAPATMLEIELTESQLLDDVERASELLAAIRERGIRIAIDDFGTGYSSMTYLQKLPIDVIKIDRSFISKATAEGFDSTVVEAVVTIGRTLALDVVAEGVETAEQLAYVRAKGVTRAQGFLLAVPMPADDADAVIFGGPLIDVDAVEVAAASVGFG